MARLAHLLLIFLNFPVSIFNSSEETQNNILNTIQPYVGRYDRQAVATCKDHWDAGDRILLHHVPWPVTLWTLPSKNFLRYAQANVDIGIKTNVIVLRPGHGVSSCLIMCLSRLRALHLVDWLVIEGSNEAKDIFKKYVASSTARNFSCDIIGSTTNKQSGKNSLQPPNADNLSVFTRECAHSYRAMNRGSLRVSNLRNSVIYVGCAIGANGYAQCKAIDTALVFDALRLYNVSVNWVLEEPAVNMLLKLARGHFDIIGDVWLMHDEFLSLADFPAVIKEQYETFYIHRGKFVLISIVNIILESNLAVCLLLVAMACVTLVLAIADLKEMNAWNPGSLSDSFLFLIASFYATSATVPRRWRWPLTRSMVHSAWLLAILPLSNYIRSELVSRLSLRSQAHVVDTLAELELALGMHTVTPCFLQGTLAHINIAKRRSNESFYAKLNSALSSRGDRESLLKQNKKDCSSCARKPDHVCLMNGLPECVLQKVYPDLVESQDKLHRVFLSFPVRKNFPLRDAFRNFVRRIVEASLLKEGRHCDSLPPIPEKVDEPRKWRQMDELSRFFALFAVLLGCACVVLALELIIANWKQSSIITFASRFAVRPNNMRRKRLWNKATKLTPAPTRLSVSVSPGMSE